VTNGVMNGALNRKVLFLLGPVAVLVMFAAVVWMASQLMNPSTRAVPGSFAAVDATPAPGTDRRKGRCGGQGESHALRGGRVSRLSDRRQPRSHLGGGGAPPAVCGVRPCRPIFAIIIEVIGYKTGDQRYDRLAYEFTKLLSTSFSLTATFGACLTFMLIILYPKFTNYLMSVSPRPSSRTCCSSSSRPFSSTPITTAGGSSIRWFILAWGSALNLVGTGS